MVRSKKKRRLSLRGVVFLLIIIIGLGFFINNTFFKSTDIPQEINNKIKEKIKQDEVYKLKFLATGDGLIHSVIYETYKQSDGSYNFAPALNEVKDIVSKYDIAYYNQETPVGDSSIAYSGFPMFYTPSSYADAMIDIGFNVVSLASNHAWDKGAKGVQNTLNYFKTTDVLYDGMNSTETREPYIIKEKNNITYTMLSYTTLDNGLSNSSNRYLVNVYDKEKVKEDIEAVRDKVDVLIVAMHWGVEYQNTPNESQKEMAEYLASLGVDIIVGNHPHILQPITTINDTVVMYSLGNFISNQYGNDDYSKIIGFLATLDITKTVKTDGTTTIDIDNLGGELIFTSYVGNPLTTAYHTDHKVIPFSKMTDDSYLKDYKRLYTKYSNVLESMGTDLDIAPLP